MDENRYPITVNDLLQIIGHKESIIFSLERQRAQLEADLAGLRAELAAQRKGAA